MDTRGINARVTQDELEVMARVTGIRIEPERLARVLEELESSLRAAASLDDAVSRADIAAGEPFDASWSTGRERR